ncbi:DUF6221 family protein [Amycolatopsis sp. YIM 10]|uniref:DUF6221 family protein n=1 Tax=Amycolatopsis sp. YIM 10 TaxID=2653857 RepID=UPI0012902EAD|nr:DUF6221 family protein [Amycolatopsis sp. YIM 10]QFU87864.1 hypothetical protein YIM_13390 [Amycolatopsis sp. YIM 10]QFU94823.1 hypothetical protein YIM_48490 [Amycolatopsis sp. YIM 10]
MNDLIEFLRARVADDAEAARKPLGVNALARAKGGAPLPRWRWQGGTRTISSENGTSSRQLIPRAETWLAEGEHIIRWDPKRALDELEAKQRIIELHASRISIWWPDQEACEVEVCKVCSESEYSPDGDVEAPCPTVRLLALPYAGHPDYREEWRP